MRFRVLYFSGLTQIGAWKLCGMNLPDGVTHFLLVQSWFAGIWLAMDDCNFDCEYECDPEGMNLRDGVTHVDWSSGLARADCDPGTEYTETCKE